MTVELQDILKVNLVLVGLRVLETEEEVKAFHNGAGAEVVIPPIPSCIGSEPPAGTGPGERAYHGRDIRSAHSDSAELSRRGRSRPPCPHRHSGVG